MILSMTGFGTGTAQKDDTAVSVEIRTVNHRFLDIHVRISREYLSLEGAIHQLVRNALERGRVDVSMTILTAASSAFPVNSSLVRAYMEAAGRLKEEFNFADSLDMKTLLNLPGVLQNRDTIQLDVSGTVSEMVNRSMREALEGVLRMRRQEGEALRSDMLRNLASVEENAHRIQALSLNSASEYLQKLRDRLAQLLPQGEIDPQRLAQEAALIADRCDISEEVARLKSHVEQYHALTDAKEKAGKKLDFLLQEMQRETNTILSKSGNLEIDRLAIMVKTDIEKLREQVQNVE